MKNIQLFIIGLILLFISLVYTNEVSMFRITPALLLPWVIYISINLEYEFALSYAFFFSLANEMINPQLLGFTSVLYVILAHLVYTYNSSFNKDKFFTILLSLLIINFIFYTIHWVYFSFSSPEPFLLLQKTMVTIAYNTLISCVVIFVIFFLDKLKIGFYD